MELLRGKQIAESICAQTRQNITKNNLSVGLKVFLVGNDPASEIYVNLKKKRAEEVGINFDLQRFSENVDQAELISEIKKENNNKFINGIIVQLPLPKSLDKNAVIESIDYKKDVDGFHPENIKRFLEEREIFWPVFPKAIVEILKRSKISGEKGGAVILANSKTFGESMSAALNRLELKAQILYYPHIQEHLNVIREADVIVSALGRPGVITASNVKNGSVIIDGGITEKDSMVLGDVDINSMTNKDVQITPVPGGVGPVTIACLLFNVVQAAIYQKNQ